MPSVCCAVTVPGLADALTQRGIAVRADGHALLAERMREWPGPVIVMTPEIVAALDAGAADAIAPCAGAGEIAARIAARLRTCAVPVGDLVIDRAERRVTRDGRRLPLHPREYALLDHLARHVGENVPRAALLRAVWGLRIDPGTNVLAVHVSRLRAKLDRPFAAPLLHTVPGGYRLAAGAPLASAP